jgi:hypothetical protein
MACSASNTSDGNGGNGDSGGNEDSGDRGDGNNCEEDPTYIACGTEVCATTAACEEGQYCATDIQRCVAECVSGDDRCGDDSICTTHGRCALVEADPEAGICAASVAQASFVIPTVVLLVDQSGSMESSYSGGTRWSVLRDALVNEDTGVIAGLETSVRFGLTLFTNDREDTCPDLISETPSLDNYEAINALYLAYGPDGDTPTGASIDAVVDELIQFSETGPKYIVLATDGEPDTCEQPNPNEGQAESVAAAQRSHENGIDLFILSVGEGDISLEHLQDVANAGVGLEVDGSEGNATFYEANDQEQLAAAFDDIVNIVLSCALTVDGVIPSSNPGLGVVYLDGDPISYNDPDGWEYANPSTIRLVGASCDTVKAGGSHIVTIEIPCYEPPV